MLEPTREFGYGFLTSLQQQLGVPYSQRELEVINTLYQQRKQYAGNAAKQAQLDEAFSYLVSLQVTQAANILNGGGLTLAYDEAADRLEIIERRGGGQAFGATVFERIEPDAGPQASPSSS